MKLAIAVSKKYNFDNELVAQFVSAAYELGFECVNVTEDILPKNIDALVIFGGDGTILHFCVMAAGKVPILCVNMGTLGFLTQLEPNLSQFEFALRAIKAKNAVVVEHSLLSLTFNSTKILALNEIALAGKTRSKTVTVEMLIDGIPASTVNGDGVIVSTPTGSTGYALAAGGPLLLSNNNSFVIVPFTTYVPSIVYPDSATLVLIPKDGDFICYVDGNPIEVEKGYVLTIKKHPVTASFITFENNLFKKLSDKMCSAYRGR